MKDLFKKYNINLTDDQVEKLDKYFTLLIEANEHMNLTAITDVKEVWVKHFLDSALAVDEIPQGASLIDIGTGAGFPGVPLAILRPDLKVTLVDSLNKRINFLKDTCAQLCLDVTLIHSRAEDLAKTEHREAYDVCVARAVSPLVTLCEYTLPFVKKGGIFIAYKGSSAKDEINASLYAMSVMGGYLSKEEQHVLPFDMGSRNILIIKKVDDTPITYPRGQNLPKLKPLVK